MKIINAIITHINSKLYIKILLAIIIPIITVSVAFSILFINQGKKIIYKELQERGETIAKNLAYNSKYGILVRDIYILSNLLNGTMQNKDVIYSAIYDSTGKILVHKNKNNIISNSIEKDLKLFSAKNMQSQFYTIKNITIYDVIIPVVFLKKSLEWDLLIEDKKGKQEKIGTVRIAISLVSLHTRIRNLKVVGILMGGLFILLGFLISSYLSVRITKPVDKLYLATKEMTKGILSTRISTNSSDEIGHLASSFNQMAKSLEDTVSELTDTRTKLLQQEKLASLGLFAGGLAHEIRNPLSAINTSSYFIKKYSDRASQEKINSHITIIEEEVKRANNIIEVLLFFVNASPLRKEKVKIEIVVHNTLETLLTKISVKNIKITEDFDYNIPQTNIDIFKLQQVVSNLVTNSIQAIENEGSIILKTYSDRNYAFIEVTDDGIGIPAENLKEIFTPFFTTKHYGTGLGLAICYRIVEEHNGSITVSSKEGQGAKFLVKLPLT